MILFKYLKILLAISIYPQCGSFDMHKLRAATRASFAARNDEDIISKYLKMEKRFTTYMDHIYRKRDGSKT